MNLRKVIQWATFGLYNADIQNFVKGTINKGSGKYFCVPGLNCYSCPGAIGSCPLGALQSVIAAYNFKFSFYVAGLLMMFGVLLGRFICGFLCPFGLFQELIHKIPSPKLKLHKVFRFVKYVVLVVFVIAMPLLITNFMGMGKPAFCQYICPAGTLEGGLPLIALNEGLRDTLGWLFSLKAAILAMTIVSCVFVYRFFCRVLCPLGAIYSLFNGVSLYRMTLEKEKCTGCGKCSSVCGMGVNPSLQPNSPECIRCAECVKKCPNNAIRTPRIGKRRIAPAGQTHEAQKDPVL